MAGYKDLVHALGLEPGVAADDAVAEIHRLRTRAARADAAEAALAELQVRAAELEAAARGRPGRAPAGAFVALTRIRARDATESGVIEVGEVVPPGVAADGLEEGVHYRRVA